MEFPSPVGELHFSIDVVNALESQLTVSVPCRGTAFLNISVFERYLYIFAVSIPCRGTAFLNCFKQCQVDGKG